MFSWSFASFRWYHLSHRHCFQLGAEMKRLFLLAVAACLVLLTGCTRIETGHTGVRVSFNGTYEPTELGVGYHQTIIGHIKEYVSNEMTIALDNLHPQTKDKSNLEDLDLAFTYSVDPSYISEAVSRYKGRDLQVGQDTYPLGQYVASIVQTSITDVFSHYDALMANDNREKIREEIRAQTIKLLAEEKLEGKVRIHQIFIKNLQIAKALQASAQTVITAQNDFKAKEFEVQTARKEAERLVLLSANKANIEYMNAKSLSDIAEGIKTGKVHTIVVPFDFKGIVNVPNYAK